MLDLLGEVGDGPQVGFDGLAQLGLIAGHRGGGGGLQAGHLAFLRLHPAAQLVHLGLGFQGLQGAGGAIGQQALVAPGELAVARDWRSPSPHPAAGQGLIGGGVFAGLLAVLPSSAAAGWW